MTLPPSALAQVADYFKVLSELSRLQVLCSLKSGSKNVTEIMEETGLGQANVSKHLKILAQAGIVSQTPQGVSVYYEIAEPFIFDWVHPSLASLNLRTDRSDKHTDAAGLEEHFPLSTVPQTA